MTVDPVFLRWLLQQTFASLDPADLVEKRPSYRSQRTHVADLRFFFIGK